MDAPRDTRATSRRAATGAHTQSRNRWACRSRRGCSPCTPTCRPPCPDDIERRLRSAGDPAPAGLSADENEVPGTSSIRTFTSTASDYAKDMSDPPADAVRHRGLARSAWPPGCWTTTTRRAAMPHAVTRGVGAHGERPRGLTRDDILDNITLYWLTATAGSPRLACTGRSKGWLSSTPKGVTIPVAVSVFPDEHVCQAPRSWAEQGIPQGSCTTTRSTRATRFAAWEQPQLFSEELRAAFRSVR